MELVVEQKNEVSESKNDHLWTSEQKNKVVEHIKNYLWTFAHHDASVKELDDLAVNLLKIHSGDLEYLKKIHFLLEIHDSKFIETVQKILRRISHSTHQEIISSTNGIRGRIDWNLTLKKRSVEGYNPTLFIFRQTEKIYDLPENQLLKFLVVKIKQICDTFDEKDFDSEKFEEGKYEKWTEQISDLKFKINQIHKHIYLRNITLQKRVTSKMLVKCSRSRNVLYKKIPQSFYLYDDLIVNQDSLMIKELVEKRVLEPNDPDRLYEIFVLLKLIYELDSDPRITLKQKRLLYSKSRYVTEFSVRNEIVRIYDQKLPNKMDDSKYKKILQYYDIEPSMRRPDVIIEFVKRGNYILLEVKRTEDKGYILNSIYKVFGYVNDFEKYLKSKPKAVLVVWSGIPKKVHHKDFDLTMIKCNLEGKSFDSIKEIILENCD